MSLRPSPSPSNPVPAEPSKREHLPALRVLWERACAPEAGRAEVDVLMRGLARRLRDGEDARERADLLHLMIGDERVGSFRGSDGRRVFAAAARALLALGPPYASELSPEILEATRKDEREARSRIAESAPPRLFTPQHQFGFWLACGVSVVEALYVLIYLSRVNSIVMGLLIGPLVGILGFLPAYVLGTEEGLRNRFLHYFCLLLAALPSLGWLWAAFLTWFISGNGRWYLLPLGLALGRWVTVYCLNQNPPPRHAR